MPSRSFGKALVAMVLVTASAHCGSETRLTGKLVSPLDADEATKALNTGSAALSRGAFPSGSGASSAPVLSNTKSAIAIGVGQDALGLTGRVADAEGDANTLLVQVAGASLYLVMQVETSGDIAFPLTGQRLDAGTMTLRYAFRDRVGNVSATTETRVQIGEGGPSAPTIPNTPTGAKNPNAACANEQDPCGLACTVATTAANACVPQANTIKLSTVVPQELWQKGGKSGAITFDVATCTVTQAKPSACAITNRYDLIAANCTFTWTFDAGGVCDKTCPVTCVMVSEGKYPCQCAYAPYQTTTTAEEKCGPSSCLSRNQVCCPLGKGYEIDGACAADAESLCQTHGGRCPVGSVCTK